MKTHLHKVAFTGFSGVLLGYGLSLTVQGLAFGII